MRRIDTIKKNSIPDYGISYSSSSDIEILVLQLRIFFLDAEKNSVINQFNDSGSPQPFPNLRISLFRGFSAPL